MWRWVYPTSSVYINKEGKLPFPRYRFCNRLPLNLLLHRRLPVRRMEKGEWLCLLLWIAATNTSCIIRDLSYPITLNGRFRTGWHGNSQPVRPNLRWNGKIPSARTPTSKVRKRLWTITAAPVTAADTWCRQPTCVGTNKPWQSVSI